MSFDVIGRQTEGSNKFPKQSGCDAHWRKERKQSKTEEKNGKLTTIREKMTERSEYWLSPSFDVIKTFRLHKNGFPLRGSSEDVMSSKKFLFDQAVITGVHDKLREQGKRPVFVPFCQSPAYFTFWSINGDPSVFRPLRTSSYFCLRFRAGYLCLKPLA